MADRELRIRVGAAVDASLNTVFRSVVDAAKRTQQQVTQATIVGNKQRVSVQKASAKEVEKVFVDERTAAKRLADLMVKDVQKSARERVRVEKDAMREIERDLARHNQARERAERENRRIFRETQREMGRGGYGGGGGGMRPPGYGQIGGVWYNRNPIKNDALLLRGASAAYHGAKRFAGDVLHGMGVDASVQGQLRGAVTREQLAATISAGGYIPGTEHGPQGAKEKVDPKVLLGEAHELGNATGTATENILEGLDKFVQMTGDLKSAREAMKDIGVVAKANSADFEDMMEAAANISIAMGDADNKGQALGAVMRTLAGQGHMGAVTMREQAHLIGMVTAQSNFFQADPRFKKTLDEKGVSNETTQRVAIIGALQQYARAKGGRVTAKQASQTAMAFVRDMTAPTEVKRMAGMGIDTYADAAHTKARDPFQLMMEVFRKAQVKGGINRDVINKVFPNVQSRAFANAAVQDYNRFYAESKATTETAKHAEAMERSVETFEDYLKVTQQAAEVEQKFAANMATAASQANIMNNNLGAASEGLMKELLPSIKAITGALVSASTWILQTYNKHLLGGADMATQNTSVNAEIRGINARSTLKQVIKTGTYSGDDLTEAGEAIKALEAATLEQQKLVTKSASPTFGTAQKYANAAVENVHFTAEGQRLTELDELIKQGDEGARQYKLQVDKLASMKDTLENLKRDQSTAMEMALRRTEVKVTGSVTVTNLHNTGAEPETNGVAPPDAPIGP